MASPLRRGAAALLVAVMLLSGCSVRAPQPGDWVLRPLSYDNRLDGDAGPARMIDVTYGMALVADTAGGFWGHSSGSWLHIDASGQAVRRFNTEPPSNLALLTAVSPTVLILSEPSTGPAYPARLVSFDTESMVFTELHRDARPLGAAAVAGDDLYFVAHSLETEAMSIERMPVDASSPPTPIVTGIEGFGRSALAVDRHHGLHLATERERYTFSADGTPRDRSSHGTAFPFVAVGEHGEVAWSTTADATQDVTAFVEGGSREAAAVLEAHETCHGASPSPHELRIEVDVAGDRTVLPFLCSPNGLAWWGDGHLVVSIGGESGAVLVDARPPL